MLPCLGYNALKTSNNNCHTLLRMGHKCQQLLVSLVIWMSMCSDVKGNYRRVCHFTNWSQHRNGIGKFKPENINPKLCTHIIYLYAKIVANEIRTTELNDKDMYRQLNAMKTSNPELKTLISVGGWKAGSAQFTKMVETSSNRRTFINSVLVFIRGYGFDGLDLNWQYPALRGGRPQDKENFASLVEELKDAFSEGNLLLTADVSASTYHIDVAYNIKAISRDLDFINIMTYAFHGYWDGTTGINSPLYPKQSEKDAIKRLNMNWSAEYWVSKGAPRQKVTIGIEIFGRTFTLANPVNNGIGASTTGPGQAGTYTLEAGVMSYYEICQLQENSMVFPQWDDEQRVPFLSKEQLWVGYDNERSITEKVKWLMDKGFGGAMIRTMDLDDFGHVCNSSRRSFPLHSIIYELLTSQTLLETATSLYQPETTKSRTMSALETTTQHITGTTEKHKSSYMKIGLGPIVGGIVGAIVVIVIISIVLYKRRMAREESQIYDGINASHDVGNIYECLK